MWIDRLLTIMRTHAGVLYMIWTNGDVHMPTSGHSIAGAQQPEEELLVRD